MVRGPLTSFLRIGGPEARPKAPPKRIEAYGPTRVCNIVRADRRRRLIDEYSTALVRVETLGIEGGKRGLSFIRRISIVRGWSDRESEFPWLDCNWHKRAPRTHAGSTDSRS